MIMMLYKSKQLAELNHDEGCEDKCKSDEVKRGSKCNKTECFSYGSEENECYKQEIKYSINECFHTL